MATPKKPRKAAKKSKKDQGSQSYHQGTDFENRTAELYRLLHYEVEHGRLFSGRQVDLFIRRRVGDIEIIRAVECKSGPVGADHIDSFHAKLLLVRKEFADANGTIVSGSTFTDAVRSHAAAVGIKLILFRDLSVQLFDGYAYATNLLRELSSNERYARSLYVEPLIGYDLEGRGELATSVVTEWLENPEWKQLTLLGDVGTGKSFLSKIVAYKLGEEFLKDPLNKPLPILVDLRNADRQLTLEGLILSHFGTSGLPQVSFDVFQYALSHGQIVIIFDGFDEMASRVTPQITTRNFHELVRCVQGQAKALLTCRTHYFKSRTEEEDIIFGGSSQSKSENVRELYYDLISRKGFKIAYLRPFTQQQIEQYVKLVKPTATREAMAKINKTYNLMELSQRPMLLDMIVKSIDKLGDSEINQSTLYEVFTDAWIHRDQWRDVLSADDKTSFLKVLAQQLWQDDIEVIHYSSLLERIRSDLADRITSQQELSEIDNEIRTASFLTRNDAGFYGFAHKSYQEYFFARFIAGELTEGRVESLYTRRISLEVAGFLAHMLHGTGAEADLEQILTSTYRPMISENALAILYGIRKNELLASSSSNLSIKLPDACDLNGAQLEQISLEGATLRKASLENANLNEAILVRTDLSEANLSDAILTKANLTGARLKSCNIHSCTFKEASLEGADISESILDGVDFSDSQLAGLIFENVGFNNVIFTRAILSDDLATTMRAFAVQSIGGDISVDEAFQLNEVWDSVNASRSSLISYARRYLLGSAAEAEDIVDDSILRVIRQTLERREDREEFELRQLLFANVKYACIEYRRSQNKTFSISLVDLDKEEFEQFDLTAYDLSVKKYLDTAVDRDMPPDQRVLISELDQIVRTEMSKNSHVIFRQHFFEGLSNSDIATNLGISTQSVSSHLALIKKRLRSWVTPGSSQPE